MVGELMGRDVGNSFGFWMFIVSSSILYNSASEFRLVATIYLLHR